MKAEQAISQVSRDFLPLFDCGFYSLFVSFVGFVVKFGIALPSGARRAFTASSFPDSPQP
jgi:hypothetical protein